MRKFPRKFVLLAALLAVGLAAWVYWNRVATSNLAIYAPADCLLYFEVDDLPALLGGIDETQAWQALSGPLGAKTLRTNRWAVRLARWLGIGSTDVVILSRAQAALVFTGTQTSTSDSTLTVRPLGALVIETHSLTRRIQSVMETHVEQFARGVYRKPQLIRKQIDGVDLNEWLDNESTHQIVTAFIGSIVIVGNDEATVMNCIRASRGNEATLASVKEFVEARRLPTAANRMLFSFASKAGLNSLLQAYLIAKSGSTADDLTASGFLARILGNLIDGLACQSSFVEGTVEDRCFLKLSDGVSEKLSSSLVAQERVKLDDLPFVPADAHSVSIYHFHDVEGFWRGFNDLVASKADVVEAVAAHALLQSILKPYGISDAGAFVHAIGTHVQTIRLDEKSPTVLITEALDRQSLRKIVDERLGTKPVTEQVGDFDVLISSTDNWSASFADNHLLVGPADAVRRCLQARRESRSITSVEAFRHAQQLIDVSLPLATVTFTNDQDGAISFVELFSETDRPTFSSNASRIDERRKAIPYTVNVSLMKNNGFEWTQRSPFGVAGVIFAGINPQRFW